MMINATKKGVQKTVVHRLLQRVGENVFSYWKLEVDGHEE